MFKELLMAAAGVALLASAPVEAKKHAKAKGKRPSTAHVCVQKDSDPPKEILTTEHKAPAGRKIKRHKTCEDKEGGTWMLVTDFEAKKGVHTEPTWHKGDKAPHKKGGGKKKGGKKGGKKDKATQAEHHD